MEEKVKEIPEEELKKVTGGKLKDLTLAVKCSGDCDCNDNFRSAADCPSGYSYVGHGVCCHGDR